MGSDYAARSFSLLSQFVVPVYFISSTLLDHPNSLNRSSLNLATGSGHLLYPSSSAFLSNTTAVIASGGVLVSVHFHHGLGQYFIWVQSYADGPLAHRPSLFDQQA